MLRLAAVLCLAAALSYGQNVGEIRLAVKDATGASVQAGGSIEGLATGVHRDFQTDDKGLHAFTGLPFGIYAINVKRDGFTPKALRVEVRTEAPVIESVMLAIAAVETTVLVHEAETLLNPEAVSSAQFAGPDQLRTRASSAPGRSVIDIVNSQPGWVLEANGVLHPRGSEYDVQYVIDGIPLYDNRSPAFAQSLGVDEFESMTMRTSGIPAEFGRSLGGVVEIKTAHDAVSGLHGQVSLQGGSFDQKSGFASLQYGERQECVRYQRRRFYDGPLSGSAGPGKLHQSWFGRLHRRALRAQLERYRFDASVFHVAPVRLPGAQRTVAAGRGAAPGSLSGRNVGANFAHAPVLAERGAASTRDGAGHVGGAVVERVVDAYSARCRTAVSAKVISAGAFP